MDNGFFEMFFKTDGRLNRLRYFKRNLAILGVNILLVTLGSMMLLEEWEFTNSAFEMYTIVCGLAVLIPRYCLDVRRLKDLDGDISWAKWIAAVGALGTISMEKFSEGLWGIFLTIVYLGVVLYLLFASGTKGENKYGADPLERS